jgi:hypothetical protein
MRENGTTGLRGPLPLPFFPLASFVAFSVLPAVVETVVLLVKVTLSPVAATVLVLVFVVVVTGTAETASTLRFLTAGWLTGSDSELELELEDSESDSEELEDPDSD